MRLLGIRSRTRRSTFYLIYHIFYFPIGKKFIFIFVIWEVQAMETWNDGQDKSNWHRVRQHSCCCAQLKPLILIQQCVIECVYVSTCTHTYTHTKKPRRRHQYSGLRYRLGNRGIVVKFPAWAKTYLFSEASRPTLGPARPSYRCVPGDCSPGVKQSWYWLLTPTSSAKVTNNRRHISTDPRDFMLWTWKTLLHLISYTHITYNLP